MTSRATFGYLSRFVLVLSLLGGSALLLAPRVARAAVTLRVEPALVELEAKPGGTGEQTLTVGNDGDEAVDVTAGVEPYRSATGDHSAVAWLAVEPARFRLEPGQEQAVTVEMAVPDGLASGGRYALVTFTTGTKAIEGSGTAMAGKLGVAFLFNVDGKGKLTRQAELERFAPVLEPDGRIGFRALLRNTGNLHVFPRGAVALTDAAGQPLGLLELPPTTPLLPAADGLLTAQGSLPLPAGAGFGATAAVDYGGEEPATAAVNFSVAPALSMAEAGVCENFDRGPTLRVALRNDGQLGLQPLVALTVREANGAPLGLAAAPPALVWPGETGGVAVDFPNRLVSGEYVLALRIDYVLPDAEGRTVLPPVEQEIPFRIGGLGAGAAPLCPPAAT